MNAESGHRLNKLNGSSKSLNKPLRLTQQQEHWSPPIHPRTKINDTFSIERWCPSWRRKGIRRIWNCWTDWISVSVSEEEKEKKAESLPKQVQKPKPFEWDGLPTMIQRKIPSDFCHVNYTCHKIQWYQHAVSVEALAEHLLLCGIMPIPPEAQSLCALVESKYDGTHPTKVQTVFCQSINQFALGPFHTYIGDTADYWRCDVIDTIYTLSLWLTRKQPFRDLKGPTPTTIWCNEKKTFFWVVCEGLPCGSQEADSLQWQFRGVKWDAWQWSNRLLACKSEPKDSEQKSLLSEPVMISFFEHLLFMMCELPIPRRFSFDHLFFCGSNTSLWYDWSRAPPRTSPIDWKSIYLQMEHFLTSEQRERQQHVPFNLVSNLPTVIHPRQWMCSWIYEISVSFQKLHQTGIIPPLLSTLLTMFWCIIYGDDPFGERSICSLVHDGWQVHHQAILTRYAHQKSSQ